MIVLTHKYILPKKSIFNDRKVYLIFYSYFWWKIKEESIVLDVGKIGFQREEFSIHETLLV